MGNREKDKNRFNSQGKFRRFVSDYGMLAILILLVILFSILTVQEQHPTGTKAAEKIFNKLKKGNVSLAGAWVIARDNAEDSLFAGKLASLFESAGAGKVQIIQGEPSFIKARMTALSDSGWSPQYLITTENYLPVVQNIQSQFASIADRPLFTPPSERWPTFLLADNLRNVANQITVIAIIAIGMTMVIITAGIDLSVGSLIALSAVLAAWLIGKMGGAGASGAVMIFCSLIAMAICGATGAFSGLMITRFRIPPFIATLAMMQVAAGVAYIISQGKPIYQLPENFILLGRGAEPFLKIPYAVILMVILYILAQLVMSRTTLGRYIYAVGGNMEAARLAGIRVNGILFFVYTLCGILAGLGGIIMASQLRSGAPTYGLTYELYVIAAVVVGGTSLSGGEGRIFGTLIGAFIIAVIQNGMNLTNVETYTQKVVLGLVILGAVLLDRMKQQGFKIKFFKSI
ncbi:Monosaccharide-transporting ATPase [Candidatus Zixiibacteriota bacterium]|nr:Monosaccharide-transporting ATPase [candidate division Zixibacteria bacterium]